MASIIQNFNVLNALLKEELKLKFFESEPVKTIDFGSAVFREACRTKIQAGKKRLAQPYHDGYIEPLLKNFNEIYDALKPIPYEPIEDKDVKKYAYLTSLVNAALQPDQELVAPYLVPIQGIVDDMYHRFLTSRTKLGITAQLDQAISPLVGIVGRLPSSISKKAPLPSTFELEQMRHRDYLLKLASGFKAGTVLIPAGYLKAPLLWGVLGHEVGGHYTLTAGRGDKLLRELQSKIYDYVLERFPSNKELAVLWMYWAEETASDVCGVLNLGPSFGIGAIHFYTAQRQSAKWEGTEKLEAYTSAESNHVAPALVPYVISGAVKALTGLSMSRKFRYIAQIDEIARDKTNAGANTLDQKVLQFPIGQTLKDPEGISIKLPEMQLLNLMRKSALQVGFHIATVPLNALDGHTLQELATWDDDDEDAAIDVANQLMKPESSSEINTRRDKPKRLQLLSGGILAVIRAPELYGRINEILLEELGVNSTAAKMKR